MTMTEDNKTSETSSNQGVLDELKEARDAISVRRVFGDAYEPDGVTIIPVAQVRGGAGGGGGESHEDDSDEKGFGAGFGINTKPVGAYEVRDGAVKFRPAIDVSGLLKGAQILAGVIVVCVAIVKRAQCRSA